MQSKNIYVRLNTSGDDMSPIARRTLPAPDPQAEGAEGGELI